MSPISRFSERKQLAVFDATPAPLSKVPDRPDAGRGQRSPKPGRHGLVKQQAHLQKAALWLPRELLRLSLAGQMESLR